MRPRNGTREGAGSTVSTSATGSQTLTDPPALWTVVVDVGGLAVRRIFSRHRGVIRRRTRTQRAVSPKRRVRAASLRRRSIQTQIAVNERDDRRE